MKSNIEPVSNKAGVHIRGKVTKVSIHSCDTLASQLSISHHVQALAKGNFQWLMSTTSSS